MKVGRSALDPAAIRAIEDSNPEIEFDWTSILKEQGAADPVHTPPRPAMQERRLPRGPSEPRAARVPPVALPPVAVPAEAIAIPAPPPRRPSAPERATEPPPAPREIEAMPPPQPDDLILTPAHAQLGVEGVMRLRARHAEILARIAERVPDVSRQDELKIQAERLNPDNWVTEGEVRVGIDAYELVLGSLRGVVGQGRRRRRRGGGQSRDSSSGAGESAGAATPGDGDASLAELPHESRGPEEEPV